MKKTTLAVLMASVIVMSSFSVCFTVGGVSLRKEKVLVDNESIVIEDNFVPVLEAELNFNRLLFVLVGAGLGLGWLLLFMRNRSSLIGISVMSLFTARWQKYGHENDYLPTNSMEPFTAKAMFMFVLLEFSILTGVSCLLGRRSGVMLALSFHLWLETGYWMGLY